MPLSSKKLRWPTVLSGLNLPKDGVARAIPATTLPTGLVHVIPSTLIQSLKRKSLCGTDGSTLYILLWCGFAFGVSSLIQGVLFLIGVFESKQGLNTNLHFDKSSNI